MTRKKRPKEAADKAAANDKDPSDELKKD